MKLNPRLKSRDDKKSPAAAVLTALLGMFLISGLLLLLLAFLLYRMELSESVVRIGIVVTYVVGGIFGGFLMGHWMKEKKYLWGLAAGICYFGIILVVSLLVKGGEAFDLVKIFMTLILCGAAGMTGGMIS